MTVLGMALVVYVLVTTLMFSNGLRDTLSSTGHSDNIVVIRNGAENEIQSGISREHVNIVLSEPEVDRALDNSAIASIDTVVIVSLRKRLDNEISNATLRGVSEKGMDLRRDAKLISGRIPKRGTNEIIVGSAIHKKFKGTDIGSEVRLVGTNWPVVGIFDAGNSAYSSEIWGDVDILMPAFKREHYSSVTFRIKDTNLFENLKQRLSKDPRLNLSMQPEPEYYESQSKLLGMFINVMGIVVSVIFGIGAILGAMITMYSFVANRTKEIGILRSIGFNRRDIFLSFILESIFIGFLGGVLGVLLGAMMAIVPISTTNFQTFTELAFKFKINWIIILAGILFSVVIGILGGALPAYQAAKLRVVEALR